MAQRGRPKKKVNLRNTSKLTPEKIELAVTLRERGFSIEAIARMLKINEATFYHGDWAILREQLNEIKARQEIERLGKVENSLYARATGQKVKEKREIFDASGNLTGYQVTTKEIQGDFKAQEFYLTNRDPSRWQSTPEKDENGSENDNILKIEICTTNEE